MKKELQQDSFVLGIQKHNYKVQEMHFLFQDEFMK